METKISGSEATKDLGREDHQDRLSKLPETILFLILEGLTTHEAARTSVLSRQWVHLFRQCSSIMMDVKDFYPKGDQGFKFSHEELVKTNVKLIQATKSMLQCERLIQTFSMKFHMIEESIDIVRCVDMAMTNRKIASLQFVIYPGCAEKDCTKDQVINNGKLFMKFLGAGPHAFGGLSHLHIRYVKLSIDDMTNMLNLCRNLEHLYLYQCNYGFGSKISIEHPRLTTLTLTCCIYQTIELKWLPRLSCLNCRTWMEMNGQYPISFGYVPQLSTLVLKNPATIHHHKRILLSEFVSNNVMVRELDLDFTSLKVWIQPEAPTFLRPVLHNLQVLFLRNIREECNLDWTMFFFEAAPVLKKIFVQVWDHPMWGQCMGHTQDYIQYCEKLYQRKSCHLSWQTPDNFKHDYLKEVIISGYQVKYEFNRYIRRVLKAAVKLEQLTLLDYGLCEHSNSCKYCMSLPLKKFPRTKEQSDMVKRQISQWVSSPIEVKVGTST